MNQSIQENLTFRVEDIYQQKQSKDVSQQFVFFTIGGEFYGIEMKFVREVVPFVSVSPLPQVPEYILGLLSVRGDLLPILSIEKFFSISSIQEDPKQNKKRILVIQNGDILIGILVDHQCESISLTKNQIRKVSYTEHERSLIFQGECEWNQKIVGLLDVKTLLKKMALQSHKT